MHTRPDTLQTPTDKANPPQPIDSAKCAHQTEGGRASPRPCYSAAGADAFCERRELARALRLPPLLPPHPPLLVRACRVEGVAAVECGVALLEDLLPHLQ